MPGQLDDHLIRNDFSDFLNNWNWELFITYTFYRPVSKKNAFKRVKQNLHLCRNKLRRMKVAGILFFCNVHGYPHVHSLFTSDQNYPNTLTNHDLNSMRYTLKWLSFYWRELKLGTCMIERVYHNRGICNYLSSKRNLDLKHFSRWDFEFYRRNQLMKLRSLDSNS